MDEAGRQGVSVPNLDELCSQWVASLPVWRGDDGISGIMPGLVVRYLLLPRLGRLDCNLTRSDASRLAPNERLGQLLEGQRTRLETEIQMLTNTLIEAWSTTRLPRGPRQVEDLAVVALRAVGSFDGAPITGVELQAVVSAHLANLSPSAGRGSAGAPANEPPVPAISLTHDGSGERRCQSSERRITGPPSRVCLRLPRDGGLTPRGTIR